MRLPQRTGLTGCCRAREAFQMAVFFSQNQVPCNLFINAERWNREYSYNVCPGHQAGKRYKQYRELNYNLKLS